MLITAHCSFPLRGKAKKGTEPALVTQSGAEPGDPAANPSGPTASVGLETRPYADRQIPMSLLCDESAGEAA